MLRPLTVGEILDATFSLYRRRFGLLFGIALLTQSPALAIQLYLQLTNQTVLTASGLWLFSWLLMWMGWLLAAGATLKAVSEIYLGRDIGIGEALSFARGKLWPLLIAGFAYSLLGGLAMLLLIVPGIIVLCGYSVVSQAVVLEQLPRPLDALGRSWDLTRGHRGRAFGLFVVMYMIILVPQMAAGMAAAFSPGLQGVVLTISTLLQIVLMPVMLVGFTLFYYDLRIRKEALDLELLGSQLTAASA
jgi:hypothetical protein